MKHRTNLAPPETQAASFSASKKHAEGIVHAGSGSVEVCDEGHGGIPQLGIHVLQMSALAFLPAIACSITVHHRWVGFSVLVFNLVTTECSHRLIRRNFYDWVDILDLVAIGSWVLYNLTVVIQMCVFLADNFDYRRSVLVFLACVFAIASGVLDFLKRQLAFRSKKRNFFHINMHLAGGLGSLLLLCSTIDLDIAAI
jgi:hypothetical protein